MRRVVRPARAIRVRVVGVMSGLRYPVEGDCPPFDDRAAAQAWCDEANTRTSQRLTRWEPTDDDQFNRAQ